MTLIPIGGYGEALAQIQEKIDEAEAVETGQSVHVVGRALQFLIGQALLFPVRHKLALQIDKYWRQMTKMGGTFPIHPLVIICCVLMISRLIFYQSFKH